MKNDRSKQNPKRKPTYLCTRPRLTSLLRAAGHEPEDVENPYDRNRSAWLFVIDDDLAFIVKRFYDCEGCKVPNSITAFLSGENL